MKKEYAKPFLAVESFQLDAAIAGSCSSSNKMPMNQGENSCNLLIYGEEIFGGDCIDNIIASPSDPTDHYCYHAFAVQVQELFMTS